MNDILAFTGHRPDKIGGYNASASERLEAFAAGIIIDLKPRSVITGMALGWDQAVARAAVVLGVPIVAAIPFAGQERKWPPESQRAYRELLSKLSELVTVCHGGYEAWKMQRRNEWMVDNCTKLVALWDGSIGGTANCVTYARRVGRETLNVWPRWLEAQQ